MVAEKSELKFRPEKKGRTRNLDKKKNQNIKTGIKKNKITKKKTLKNMYKKYN